MSVSEAAFMYESVRTGKLTMRMLVCVKSVALLKEAASLLLVTSTLPRLSKASVLIQYNSSLF